MAAVNELVAVTTAGAVAVITIDSPPVNALSVRVRAELRAAIVASLADPVVQAVLITCAGRTFTVGADIRELENAADDESFFELQDLLDSSVKPIIAAIHGTALGGGLELAMTCHARVAPPSARCGLPEVHLGILPGAGGTQRLPRLVGAERALQMMAYGVQVPAAECLEMGLLDAVLPEEGWRAAALQFAQAWVEKGRPLTRVRDQQERVLGARAHPEIFSRFLTDNARRFRGLLAPPAIVRCVEAAVLRPFEEGMLLERKLSKDLMRGRQAATLQYVFGAERQAQKRPRSSPAVEARAVGAWNIGKVVIVGASAAAERFSAALVKGGCEPLGMDARTLVNVLASAPLDADLIVQPDGLADSDVLVAFDGTAGRTILASETLAEAVGAWAARIRRPQAAIGLHLLSVPGAGTLLEIVPGAQTAPEVTNTMLQWARQIRCAAVLVADRPEFCGIHFWRPLIEEAESLVMEGATPREVDEALEEFGLALGPFALCDELGLDGQGLVSRPDRLPVATQLRRCGRLGRRSSAGYFDYDAEGNAQPSPVVDELVKGLAQRQQTLPGSGRQEAIRERCLYRLINHCAYLLQARGVVRASDADIIAVKGFGWPAFRGGPLFYADEIGLRSVVQKLHQFELLRGEEFRPAPLLEQLSSAAQRISAVVGSGT
jgi:3-hydroxyacyl-CoA dehydrogenase